MRDYTEPLAELRRRVADAHSYLRIDEARERLTALEADASRPDLWDDPDAARQLTTEMANVRTDVELVDALEQRVEDLETLFDLGREESDDSVEAEIDATVEAMRHQLDELERRSLFTDSYDSFDAVCEIHSGAGGTDAQDWAEMLLRMYRRWAENSGFALEIESVTEGQEAGILSAEFTVKGRYAFGMLKAERGTHRLVRISPFDNNARRQTAFAGLSVVPMLEDDGDVEIDDKELRIDVYRSSGAGGQHVNTTDSAVRITHLPTGIVTSCQNERSQIQNRDRAMQMLAMKLVDLEMQRREEELAKEAGEAKRVEWGSQIRSYVLQPYQQVKDERSGLTSGTPEGVLDGDVGPFMEAWLRGRRAQGVAA